MDFFTQRDLDIVEQYAGQSADDKVKHEELKQVYRKLGHLCHLLDNVGYSTHIIKDPRKQAGRGKFEFEQYQWSKVVPREFKDDCKDKFAYIVGIGEGTLHYHLMGIKGYQHHKASLNASKACRTKINIENVGYDDLVQQFIAFDIEQRRLFEDTGAALGVVKFQRLVQQRSLHNMVNLLLNKKQIILQGPPGTGKTYTAKDIAERTIFGDVSSTKEDQKKRLDEDEHKRFKLIQFHPAYSYEDFVRGITIEANGSNVHYKSENRVLGIFAQEAAKAENQDKNYVIVIDEINRANLPAVLGELIYALEYRGHSVESMYRVDGGDNKLILPENLYIIGTMNTADRSVGHIDYAIRRRFAFESVLPNLQIVHPVAQNLFRKVSELFISNYDTLNWDKPLLKRSTHMARDFKPEDVWLGHSYFIPKKPKSDEDARVKLQLKLDYEIKPLLREYVKDGILHEDIKLDGATNSIEYINQLSL